MSTLSDTRLFFTFTVFSPLKDTGIYTDFRVCGVNLALVYIFYEGH